MHWNVFYHSIANWNILVDKTIIRSVFMGSGVNFYWLRLLSQVIQG